MMRAFVAALLAVAATSVCADQMTVIADGKLIRRADQAWLRVGSNEYPLQFSRTEIQRFALSLHNRNVHVEGILDTIPKGRVGAGQVYIRAETLVEGHGEYGRHGYSRRGDGYTDTIVVPRQQTGPIPSRTYPRY
ncbi:MAG TPA: hypothetical protein VEJ63_15835 [Planctomycetota bacterium]|nr:hypothetical protein [Planctomycetota bacterium]